MADIRIEITLDGEVLCPSSGGFVKPCNEVTCISCRLRPLLAALDAEGALKGATILVDPGTDKQTADYVDLEAKAFAMRRRNYG